MPNHCSTTMAQVVFIAAKSYSNLDILLVILLDTRCSQYSFHRESDFQDIRYFQPYKINQGISRIGKTFFWPIGISTVKINVSVQGYHKTLLLTNALYCLSL